MWISELFYTKVAFGIEILIIMHLLGFNMPKKKHFLLRIIASFLLAMTLVILFPIFDSVSYTWWYSSIMYFICFFFCAASLFIVYDVQWKRIFLISVYSYTAQHLAYQIFFLLTKVFNIKEALFFSSYGSALVNVTDHQMTMILSALFVAVYDIVYTLTTLFFAEKLSTSQKVISNFYVVVVSFLVLLIVVVINSTIIYRVDSIDSSTLATLCFHDIIACIMIFFVIYLATNKKSLETNLNTSNQLLAMAEKQYQQNKANADLINIKVHDLKQQIRTFGEKEMINASVAKSLENVANIYDSKVNTNNVALDLILSEKSLICQKENISLKVFADASKLNFIEESDIYSLFGNALDNAIRAVNIINDPSKRFICLYIREVLGSKTSITVENYYDGEVKFDNKGFPVSTKKYDGYHGFGMQSMYEIAKKYNGDIRCYTDKGMFKLLLLF